MSQRRSNSKPKDSEKSKRVRVQHVHTDQETGEKYGVSPEGEAVDLAGVDILFPGRKRHIPKGESWALWFYGLHEELADNPLRPAARRVLDVLILHLGFANWTIINQAALARKYGMAKATVSRAFEELREREIIMKVDHGDEKVAKAMAEEAEILTVPAFHNAYRLNPHRIWRGQPHLLVHARHWWDYTLEQAEKIESHDPNQQDLLD